MTEPTDKPLDDPQLDEYLKGDSSVSRQYRRLPNEDVPASLDRLVLRQAEEAVQRPSRPAWRNWAKPLAVAASAVLVVSIVVETGLKDETRVTSQHVRAPAESKMLEESAGAAPAPAPKVEVPPPMVFVEPPAPVESPAFADLPSVTVASAPAAAPAPAPESEAMARSRPPAANETADTEIQEALAKSEQEDKVTVAADESRQKSAREEDAREQRQAAAQRSAEPAAVLSYSRSLGSSANGMATLEKTYTEPEAWLKDIRQLRKDNKQEEAEREWRRFREAFPDYAVAEMDVARGARK